MLVQTTVPAYRQGFLEELAGRLGDRLTVLAGSDYFDATIRLEGTHPRLERVSNHFVFGRRLLWQSGAVRRAVRAETAILELNPRVISSWLILLARRLLGRRTILWGHAWPRKGRTSTSDRVRHVMRRLGCAVVTYGETQAEELRRTMPAKLIRAAPNGLYPASQAGPATAPASPSSFVFVGRLVEAKKPQLLLEAFLRASDRLPTDVQVVFVGDGPLEPSLRERASAVPERVRFAGPIWDVDGLRAVYAKAIASVSSGYVGLSLTQSLWFGVPALIARDDPHSPEIEAADEGRNAVFFDSDSVESLSDALLAVAQDRDAWLARRSAIAQECASRYSVETMVDSVITVVREVEHEH